MIRWLKIARAEFTRDIKLVLRYPIDLATGVAVMFVLFMGLFLGGKTLARGVILESSLDAMIISFSLWFLALMAMNTVSTDIEAEARQGTLEQVYLCAPNYLGLLWVRALVHMLGAAGVVFVFSLLLQLATGRWLQPTAAIILPSLAVLALTIIQLCGFGLILGGLSLLFKRIGQLSAIIQFMLLFVAMNQLRELPTPWRDVALHLPLARGAEVMKMLFVQDYGGSVPTGLLWLVIDTLLYAAAGTLIFAALERAARRAGTMAHY